MTSVKPDQTAKGVRRVQLLYAGVDQHARIGMVDDVHVDRHPLALDEKVCNPDGRDGEDLRRGHRRLFANDSYYLLYCSACSSRSGTRSSSAGCWSCCCWPSAQA